MTIAASHATVSTRVVACTGGSRTAIEQRELPAPGPGELLLDVSAVGLCGTDLFKLDTGTATPGTVLGHELVGVIRSTGTGVRGFREGMRVAVPHHVPCGECAKCRRGSETLCEMFRVNLMAPGGFSDHVLIRERAVVHAAREVPDTLADATVVWMEPAACVLRGIDRAAVADDGLAVVFGAGSMGLLHLLVLKATRPQLAVAMVDIEPRRLRLARTLGADEAIVPDGLDATVGRLGAGLGADTVFDTVGSAAVLDRALEAAREGGTVVLFAHAPEGERAGFDLNALFKHERRLIGSYSGTPAEQGRIFELMRAGKLDPSPLVSHRLDLGQFQHGVALVKARQAIKVVFTGAGRGT